MIIMYLEVKRKGPRLAKFAAVNRSYIQSVFTAEYLKNARKELTRGHGPMKSLAM